MLLQQLFQPIHCTIVCCVWLSKVELRRDSIVTQYLVKQNLELSHSLNNKTSCTKQTKLSGNQKMQYSHGTTIVKYFLSIYILHTLLFFSLYVQSKFWLAMQKKKYSSFPYLSSHSMLKADYYATLDFIQKCTIAQMFMSLVKD